MALAEETSHALAERVAELEQDRADEVEDWLQRNKGDRAAAVLAAHTAETGDTLLHRAVALGHLSLTESLLRKRANPDAVNFSENSTPLHFAASQGNTDLCDILIRYGASRTALDHRRRSPIDLAEVKGHLQLAKQLKAVVLHGAPEDSPAAVESSDPTPSSQSSQYELNELNAAHKEIARLNSDITSKKQELAIIQAQVLQQSSEIEHFKVSSRELEQKANSEAEVAKALRTQLSEVKQRETSLEEMCRQKEEMIRRFESEHAAGVLSVEEERSRAQAKLQSLESELNEKTEKAHREMTSQLQVRNTLEARLSGVEVENSRLKAELNRLEEQLGSKPDATVSPDIVTTLESENVRLRQEAKQNVNVSQDHLKRIDDLQEQVRSLEIEVNRKDECLSEKETLLGDLRERQNQLEQESHGLRERNIELQSEVEKATPLSAPQVTTATCTPTISKGNQDLDNMSTHSSQGAFNSYDLVLDSWEDIVGESTLSGVGKLFYDTLFQAHPSLMSSVFKNTDLNAQAEALAKMLDTVLRIVGTAEAFDAILGLGYRHHKYGVQANQYEAVEIALLKILQLTLGNKFNGKLRSAWKSILDVVKTVFLQGLKEAEQDAAATAKQSELTEQVETLERKLSAAQAPTTANETHAIDSNQRDLQNVQSQLAALEGELINKEETITRLEKDVAIRVIQLRIRQREPARNKPRQDVASSVTPQAMGTQTDRTETLVANLNTEPTPVLDCGTQMQLSAAGKSIATEESVGLGRDEMTHDLAREIQVLKDESEDLIATRDLLSQQCAAAETKLRAQSNEIDRLNAQLSAVKNSHRDAISVRDTSLIKVQQQLIDTQRELNNRNAPVVVPSASEQPSADANGSRLSLESDKEPPKSKVQIKNEPEVPEEQNGLKVGQEERTEVSVVHTNSPQAHHPLRNQKFPPESQKGIIIEDDFIIKDDPDEEDEPSPIPTKEAPPNKIPSGRPSSAVTSSHYRQTLGFGLNTPVNTARFLRNTRPQSAAAARKNLSLDGTSSPLLPRRPAAHRAFPLVPTASPASTVCETVVQVRNLYSDRCTAHQDAPRLKEIDAVLNEAKSIEEITYISVTTTGCIKPSILAVLDLLPVLTSVRTVSLCGHKLGTETCVHLLDRCKRHRSLETIFLDNNLISRYGADSLLELLQQNKFIKKISLSQNSLLSQHALEAIQQQCMLNTAQSLGIKSGTEGTAKSLDW